MSVRKNSLSFDILLALEKTVEGYARFQDFAYHHYRYINGLKNLDKSDLAQAIKRLRERGLIKDEKNNIGEIVIKLTDEGRDIIKNDNWDEKSWDGKWRV